jgi:hypothetical protein
MFAGILFGSKVPEFVLVSALAIVDGPEASIALEAILLFCRLDAVDAYSSALYAERCKRAPQFRDFHPTFTPSSMVIAQLPVRSSPKR